MHGLEGLFPLGVDVQPQLPPQGLHLVGDDVGSVVRKYREAGYPVVAAETGGFVFEFGPDVQPQHISDAYEAFIGMGNKRQMYLDRHHEKVKKKNAESKKGTDELEVDPFSNFKGLSDKDIEYIKAYKGPGIDELIEKMGEKSE